MELLNATVMPAGYTQGIDVTGRESLVVVIKGTFNLPLDGSEPKLVATQEDIVEADISSGEPGFSAILYESDYAPFKPYCDVLLNGSAYAPKGKLARSVVVGIKMTNSKGVAIQKAFNVIGDRKWSAGVGIRSSEPKAFNKKPISYDVAFGGIDNYHPDEKKHNAYLPNPVGCGFHECLDNELVDGTPLPNTEERGKSVTFPTNRYKPMGFGVVGRSWPERVQYAGTYDQHWVDNTFPFLPSDFDERYYQAAPREQQCDYLQGGEVLHLVNLTHSKNVSFRIPRVEIPVVFFKKRHVDVKTRAVADTLLIEPDKGVFSITWRIREPLRKNMFEILRVSVGTMTRAWWRAQRSGKIHYQSLAHVGRDTNDD